MVVNAVVKLSCTVVIDSRYGAMLMQLRLDLSSEVHLLESGHCESESG